MSVGLSDDSNETIPALLPVYLVVCKSGIAAAVNGQTGKVSVDTGKQKDMTRLWWITPALVTLAVVIAGWYFGGFALGFMGGLVFGLVLFVVAHSRHKKVLVEEILTYPDKKEEHNDTRTEFFIDFGQGQVPVEIKFFTPWRIIKTIVIVLAIIFLPVLLAIPIQLLRGLPLTDIQIGYGAAWYCIPGFFTIIASGGLAKSMMYGVPLYYEKMPNGGKKRRRLASQQASSKQASSKKKLFPDKDISLASKEGCFIIGLLLFMLIGSTLAMIY